MELLRPLFLIPASVGIIFIIAGYISRVFPPKKINLLYGYRTLNSMKSKERWDFAQSYSSQLMIQSGVLIFLLCFASLFLRFSEVIEVVIALGWVITLTIYIFIKTEKALKVQFD